MKTSPIATCLLLLGLLVIGIPHATVHAEVAVTTQGSGDDQQLILQNKLVQFIIRPRQGGRVTSFQHKPTNIELTGGEVEPKPPGGYGLLADRFIPHGGVSDKALEHQPYSWRIVEQNTRHATIELIGHPTGEALADVQITKRLTLLDNETMLRVQYTIANTSGVGGGARYAQLWLCNVLRPSGFTAQYPLTFYQPIDTGIEAFRREKPDERGENLWREPVRDWRGVLDDSGMGAAVQFDSRSVKQIYSWLPPTGAHPDYPTFEWMTRTLQLDPVNTPEGEISGRPMLMEMQFLPVIQMPAIHGVGDGLVASLRWNENSPPVIDLYAARSMQSLELELTLRAAASDDTKSISRWNVALNADGHRQLTPDTKIATSGRTVLRLVAKQDGKVVLDTERDFDHGADTGADHDADTGQSRVAYKLARLQRPFADQQPRVDTIVSMDLVTPHVPWLRPLAGGPIKTLLVMPWRAARETVELAQRLEIDPQLVATLSPQFAQDSQQTRGIIEQEITRQLQSNPAVIIIGAQDWDPSFSPQLRKRILAYVDHGGGLVYVWPAKLDMQAIGATPDDSARDQLIHAIDLSIVPGYPAANPTTWLHAYRLGKGRIVILNTPINTDLMGRRHLSAGGLTPQNPMHDATWPFWEYQLGLVAKATLWAAGRESATRIAAVEQAWTKRDFNSVATFDATVTLTHQGDKTASIKLIAQLLDEWNEPVGAPQIHSQTIDAKTTRRVDLHWPDALPPGLLRLEMRLFVDDRAADLAIRSAQVERVFALEGHARPGLVAKEGDVSASVEVRRLVPLHADSMAHWSLRDATGRLLEVHKQPLQGDKTQVVTSLTWEPSLKRALFTRHVITLEIKDKQGTRLARHDMPFAIDHRDHDDFTSLIWDGTTFGYLRQANTMALNQFDTFDTLLGGLTYSSPAHAEASTARMIGHADMASAHGYHFQVQGLYHFGRQPAGTLIRNPSLDDPQAVTPIRNLVNHKADLLSRYAPAAYLLGDEMGLAGPNTPNDLDHHPAALARFRETLRQQYDSIASLNDVWQSSFDSWEQVVPPTYAQAAASGHWAGWNDHRDYMDSSVVRFFADIGQEIRSHDPNALIGYSGGATLNLATVGTDRTKLYHVAQAVSDYGPDTMHMQRSFRNNSPRQAGWWWGMYGGGVEAQRRHNPWHNIFSGLNTSSFFATFWRQNSVFYDLSIINLDGTPKQNILAELQSDLAPLQRGLGKLLLHAGRNNAGIGVFYSQQNERAAAITATQRGVTPDQYRNARLGFESLLMDLGLNFDLISSEQLVKGRLGDGFGVLILPLTQSLSLQETAAIETFVKQGGVVMADGFTGRLDEHMRLLKQGRLDALLGIQSADARPSSSSAAVVLTRTTSSLGLPALMENITAAAPSRGHVPLAQDARPIAWGGLQTSPQAGSQSTVDAHTPALVVHRVNQGTAITLNMDVAAWLNLRRTAAAREFLETMGGLFKELGVTSGTTINVSDRHPPMLAMHRFDLGASGELTGLLWDVQATQTDQSLTATYSKSGHVYDVIEGKYLGQSDQVTLRILPPARHAILAFLPAKPGELRLKTPASLKQGETLAAVAMLTDAPAGTLMSVHFLLRDPQGVDRRIYRRNVLGRDGRFEMSWPLAMNEQLGRWQIEARDVITGLRAQTTFVVLAGETQ